MTETEKYFSEILCLDISKISFSCPSKKAKYKKAILRRTGNDSFQLECFTDKQAFHENFEVNELSEKVQKLFTSNFMQAEIFTDLHIYSAKVTKKGTFLHNRRKNDSAKVELSHNRTKKYIIDIENLPPVFKELGIITDDGKIINSKYDKFKQICRFTELINDAVLKDPREVFNIIDFGCGKSYLTFVIYYYFAQILHKKVRITGLDLKKDVIDKCNMLSKEYGFDGIEFICCDVKDYVPSEKPDMVIALHACDTSTDYAIDRAVKWGADYIFAVPCCQKEARSIIKANKLTILTEYGLIKERLCALITDTLRAKLIELNGYSCDIAEFVDFDNSPKNILIRARRKKSADKYSRIKTLAQIQSIKDEFGIKITLEKLLEENE